MVDPRKLGRALLAPRDTLADWRPSLAGAVVLVLGAALLNAGGVAVASEEVRGAMTEQVTVENPEYPGDVFCENTLEIPSPQSDFFENTSYQRPCEKPRTVNRSLATAAGEGLSGRPVQAFLATCFAWMAFVAAGRLFADDSAQIADASAVVALAFVPASLRYLARPVAVRQALETWIHPASLEGVSEAAVAIVALPPTTWYVPFVAATLLWQLYVLAGGIAARTTASIPGAVASVGVPLAVVSTIQLLGDPWVPSPSMLFPAVVVLGIGAGYTFAAEELIAFDTSVELIGMRGREGVEPKAWYLALHRLAGLLVLLLAFALAGGVAFG